MGKKPADEVMFQNDSDEKEFEVRSGQARKVLPDFNTPENKDAYNQKVKADTDAAAARGGKLYPDAFDKTKKY